MISHTTLGTNDLPKAEAFYNALLKVLGAEQVYHSDNVIFWSFGEGQTKLALTVPHDNMPATYGNGTMVALSATSVEQVDNVYRVAISYGGTCEGMPGERADGSYYAAYVRDLDGNKIAIFHRE